MSSETGLSSGARVSKDSERVVPRPTAAVDPTVAVFCLFIEHCCCFGAVLCAVGQILPCNMRLKHYSWMMGSPNCPGNVCAAVAVVGLAFLAVAQQLTTVFCAVVLEGANRACLEMGAAPAGGPRTKEITGLFISSYLSQTCFCCVLIFPAHMRACSNSEPGLEATKLLWHSGAVVVWLLVQSVTTLLLIRELEYFVLLHDGTEWHAPLSASLARLSDLGSFYAPVWFWTTLATGAFDESRGEITSYTGPLEIIGLFVLCVYLLELCGFLRSANLSVIWSR